MPPQFDNRRMGRFERRWRAASRRHWAILGVSVVLVLAGIRIAVGERARPGVVVLPAPSRPLAPPPADSAVETAVSLTPPAVPRLRGSERVEVCGLGWVQAAADGSVDPATLARVPAFNAARRRLLDSLASSGDDFERSESLWLKMIDPSSDATLAADLREQIAQRATTTRDPRAYAMAFKTCRLTLEAGSCALLNARRWAQLDADNGDPWLYVLDEAATRKDSAQVEEAMFRLGAASRVDMRYFAVPRALAQHADPTDAGHQAANLLTVVSLGGMAALPFPAFQVMTRACQGFELSDANRRQRCEAAASALAERSDTVFYASIGASMGRRLGWGASRTDAVAALSSALQESLPTLGADPLQWSCVSVASMLERLSRQGVVGETGFAREWIRASGTTFERYAAQEPERRRRRAEAFAIAASAARAAASAAGDTGASEPAATPYSATPLRAR